VATRLTIAKFITKAISVHGDTYGYLKSIYNGICSKIIINCFKHGEFLQTPDNHLQGRGCSKCVSNVSYIGSRWLDSLGIPNDPEHREVKGLIFGRKFIVDGYVPETNTVYEFYGDRSHGNPKLYNSNDKGLYGLCYGDVYQRTIAREEIFKLAGFSLVTIWESDYKKQLIQEFVLKSTRKPIKAIGRGRYECF
jgi:hypothetical protein